MLKAALYIRVSTDEQTEYSPSAQKTALKEYAAKNSMTVCDENIFSDEGYSGRTAEKRPSFMRMIAAAKSNEKRFDVILVHKFDRFARNRETSVLYKEMLKKDCGIKVISITESVADEKIAIISDAILEAMAEYYSINLSEEVKKGMTEKARRGGFQTSPPLGYKVGTGGIEIEPEEAETVREIYDGFVNENKSLARIARGLNDSGVLTKRGNKFESRTVCYILKNPIYIGFTHWTPTGKAGREVTNGNTITVRSTHPAIIPECLFYQAGDKLEKMKSKYRYKARPDSEYRHWLSGIVRCSVCGSRLTLSAKGKYPSFQCRGYSAGVCGTSHSITLKKIETSVLEKLDRISAYSNIGVDYINEDKIREYENKRKAVDRQSKQILRKSERASVAYLNGVYNLSEYEAIKNKIEEEKNKIDVSSDGLNIPVNIIQKANKVTDVLLSESDTAVKSAALKSITEDIVFNKKANTIDIYMYDPD